MGPQLRKLLKKKREYEDKVKKLVKSTYEGKTVVWKHPHYYAGRKALITVATVACGMRDHIWLRVKTKRKDGKGYVRETHDFVSITCFDTSGIKEV